MDKSELRPIVNRNIVHLVEQLRLWEWHIDVYYEHIEGAASGVVEVNAPYQRAHITLDPDGLNDEETALFALRHELIHVFLWPFHAFGHFAQAKSGGELSDEDHHTFVFYNERMVRNVEHLLDMHNLPMRAEEGKENPQYLKDVGDGVKSDSSSAGPPTFVEHVLSSYSPHDTLTRKDEL